MRHKDRTLPQDARTFAEWAHSNAGQKRKYTGEPYIVHPDEVAALVGSVTDDEAMIAAAYLHDVVEDTCVSLERIRELFGDDVAGLVGMLTDVSRPEDGNRSTRKALDLAHIATACPRAKTIKLADVISNTASISAHDQRFAKTYIPEMMLLLGVLTEGNQALYAKATAAVISAAQSSIAKVGAP